MAEESQELYQETAAGNLQEENQPQEGQAQTTPLTEAILSEEYGFPASARLLACDEQFRAGDYLVDPDKREILLVANGCTYQVFKKNMLAAKLRQRATRRPDTTRYRHAVRIAPSDAPIAHQLALLPQGSYVEVPAGKFGITTATGVRRGSQEIAFTDIMPNAIANLHPPKDAQAQRRPRQPRGTQDRRRQQQPKIQE